MEATQSTDQPKRLSIAYAVFIPSLLAQYLFYWLIGIARSQNLIEARTMFMLENMVFYAAPVAVLLAMLILLIAASTTPDPRHLSNAKRACAVGLLFLVPQAAALLLALSGAH